jgi:CHAT domain-containing protein/tetratricopeptide (TPR) repeat protein
MRWVCVALSLALGLPASGQVSDARVDAIRGLMASGNYARAESEAANLRSDVVRAAAPTRDLQRATDLLVQALYLNGRGAEPSTRALAEEVVQSRLASAGPDDVSVADSLRNLGNVLLQAGLLKAAVVPLRRALAIREGALGPEHIDSAADLDDLARALLWAEHWDEALDVATRAVRIRESALGPNDARVARSLEVQGEIFQRQGQHAQARTALERALSLREAAQSPPPELAGALSLLGEQLWFGGDVLQAKEYCSKALSLAEASLRPEHPELAVHLRRLALPVDDLGDVTRARALRERGLAIALAALGPAHPSVGLQMNDLANSLYREGDYHQARSLFDQALKAYSSLGADSAGATAAAHNLGVVNANLSDYVEAERYYRLAMSTWIRVHGPDHPYVAYSLEDLGDLRRVMGQYGEAMQLHQRALAIREAALGPNALDVARTLTKLAETLLDSGDTAGALERATRAVEIWQRSGAHESPDYVGTLNMRAAIQARMGDPASARASYEEAITMLVRLYGPSHHGLAEMKRSLAMALASTGERTRAIQSAFEAEQIDREHVSLTVRYLAERQALGYTVQLHQGLGTTLSLAEQVAGYEGQLLDRIIRARSLTLDEMAARHQTAGDAAQPNIAALRTSLTAARQRLANITVRGPGALSAATYRELVAQAMREKEAAERALAEKSTVFNSELARKDVGVREVGNALPHGSVLLSFYRYDRLILPVRQPSSGVTTASSLAAGPPRIVPSYVAFVLRPGGADPVTFRLGDADAIDALVSQWRSALTGGLRTGTLSRAERQLRLAGDLLRRRVWDPIAASLETADTVFVVPDGSLNLFPLTALPTSTTSYLLEHGPTIHYLSTERDMVRSDNVAARGLGLLALGDPLFEAASVTTVAAARDANPVNATFRGSMPSCPSFQAVEFKVLPASGKEANEIAGLWKQFGPAAGDAAGGPRVLVGRAADERSFKELSPGRRVLHLATHGFFLGNECIDGPDASRSVGGLAARKKPPAGRQKPSPAKPPPVPKAGAGTGENPLILSGLALAGANRRAAATGAEEDGILTAEEVASLDLSGVEWAVLSACDTGLGEIKAGEGVFGLRRAFQIAGAHTVIMSLWSVEDRAAMTWMRAMYEGRLAKKLDTAAAVREASLTVLRERRARGESTHPFYWAGFVASGDWR